MRKQYDFSKGKRNVHAKRLKDQVMAIRTEPPNMLEITLPSKATVSVFKDETDKLYTLRFFRWEGALEIRTRFALSHEAAVALVQLLGMHGVIWDQSKPIACTMEMPRVELVPAVQKKRAKKR